MRQSIHIPSFFKRVLEKGGHGLAGAVFSCLDPFEKLLAGKSPPLFPDYTDHGLTHIEDVLGTAHALLRPQARALLTPEDVATLIVATLLHDLAMHITEDGVSALIAGKTGIKPVAEFGDLDWPQAWAAFTEQSNKFSWQENQDLFGSPKRVPPPGDDPEEWTGSQRRLLGEFVRRNHGRLAHEIANWGFPARVPFDPILLPSGLGELQALSGLVARSHALPLHLCVDHLKKGEYRNHVDPLRVHAPFLMVLLRVSDYLQLQADRAPEIRLRVQRLRSPISVYEWKKHEAIRDMSSTGDDPESLLFLVRTKDPKTYVGIKKLLDGLQAELDDAWAVLGEVYGRRKDTRLNNLGLTKRRVNSNLSDVQAGLVNTADVRAEFIDDVASQHSGTLPDEGGQADSIIRLRHELLTPLVAIRGAVESMNVELQDRGIAPASLFSDDYLADIWSWTELIRIVLHNAQSYAMKAAPLRIAPSRTDLREDVMMPTIRGLTILLHDRGLTDASIACASFADIPALWVDKHQFHQVAFNILSNSIRFSGREDFRVEIDANRARDQFNVIFRDWGVGIDADLAERAFDLGTRGRMASQMHVNGQGQGLWVVRRVIEAHGGHVRITGLRRPTEITVELPATLAELPAKSRRAAKSAPQQEK